LSAGAGVGSAGAAGKFSTGNLGSGVTERSVAGAHLIVTATMATQARTRVPPHLFAQGRDDKRARDGKGAGDGTRENLKQNPSGYSTTSGA
jgi:hypothetical protein